MNTSTWIVLGVILVLLVLSIRSILMHGASDCSGCGAEGFCHHSCADLKKDLKRARHDMTQQ